MQVKAMDECNLDASLKAEYTQHIQRIAAAEEGVNPFLSYLRSVLPFLTRRENRI
jgi:hypothetical protein